MGQFSVTFPIAAGSVLSDIQQDHISDVLHGFDDFPDLYCKSIKYFTYLFSEVYTVPVFENNLLRC